MGVIKILIAFFVIIGLLFVYAYFATDDTSLDNSLEDIDDTKFPISDYLYFEKKDLPQPSNQPFYNNTNSNDNYPIINDNNATNIDGNSTSINNNTNNNATAQKEENKSIEELFNNIGNKVSNATKSVANEILAEPEVDEKTLKAREAILSTRTGSISILSKEKNSTNLSLEYGVSKFSNLNEQDKASNEHKLYRTISAMKMIPAVLITNISSDIGGKVIAQVEEDIYAEMGKAILIPKGSKVLGNYANNNKIGEYRLNVLWTRILTPQGVNIMLTDSYGADLAGAMGLIGDVDNKYWQRYGIPLALSTISNGLILTINNITSKYTNNQNPYITAQLMQNMQGDLSSIMQQIIREQVKIQPTIRIEKGSRIFITSNKDIFFPIPKNNEVMARFFDEVKFNNTQNIQEEDL